MIKLEHVNLVVTDLAELENFLLAAFPSWSRRGEGQMDWAGKQITWAHIGDDVFYVAARDGAETEARVWDSHDSGLAHLGFNVDDLAGIEHNLAKAGYQIHHSGPAHTYRKNHYYMDNQGLQYEFVEYLTDKAELRNSYE